MLSSILIFSNFSFTILPNLVDCIRILIKFLFIIFKYFFLIKKNFKLLKNPNLLFLIELRIGKMRIIIFRFLILIKKSESLQTIKFIREYSKLFSKQKTPSLFEGKNFTKTKNLF